MFTDRSELDPRPVFICDWCGRTIYESEYFYYLDHGDTVVCEDCIANCKEVAEYEPN